MDFLKNLFTNNIQWAAEMKAQDKDFFNRLAEQQTPEYLWIGCADSRVPANDITGLQPGEVFVHRNVANIVNHTDTNCLSVLQYAIEILKVKHIIVCGHYDCGGIKAAMENQEHGLIDNWLRGIKDLYQQHHKQINALANRTAQVNYLCEQNVIRQVAHVCHTTFVQNAWKRNQNLIVHGWIYNISDGFLTDLDVCCSKEEDVPDIYRI